ncbi:hypothetical protein AU197_15020 [Mycobacterium sp. IS-1590]|uniref:hypothetical protein n=1 Tax=Mycobacterium sp. IS-1590 TaxID=1772286 RepID=UPI000749ACBB|nr:hypothetical protein [Mycobacterium sp. IS-1590]KUI42407.1 hypothetical protein AU197_15020 [Mycobacterium sp. IS-1590]
MSEPEERGKRGTGSDQPSGGPADRPSDTYRGDESVPAHEDGGKPDFQPGFTNEPPKDVEPEIPPYEGRQQSAKPEGSGDDGGERTAGAVKPATDAASKAPPPSETMGGATASPADEQPASQMPESDRDDDRVGPSHTTGAGRAEDKR